MQVHIPYSKQMEPLERELASIQGRVVRDFAKLNYNEAHGLETRAKDIERELNKLRSLARRYPHKA